MKTTNVAKSSGIGWLRPRAVRVGAAASGLAAVLVCGSMGPAVAAPNETRQVHVEGQLLPVEQSPGVYRSPVGWSAPIGFEVSGSSTPGLIGRGRSGRSKEPHQSRDVSTRTSTRAATRASRPVS